MGIVTFQVTRMFGLGFISFLAAILNLVGLFLLLIAILLMAYWAAILNWNFRLQTYA